MVNLLKGADSAVVVGTLRSSLSTRAIGRSLLRLRTGRKWAILAAS